MTQTLDIVELPHALGFGCATVFSAQADTGAIEGYGAVFGELVETHGVRLERGAFKKSLAAHKAHGTRPAMLWSHSLDQPIGRWVELQEDERGLRVQGQLNLATDRGKEAFAHLKAGDVDGLSIGFLVPEGGAKRGADGVVSIHEVQLFEISVVAVPANRPARISQVHQLGSRGELEKLLRTTGLSRGAAFKIAQGGWPALSKEEPELDLDAVAARIDAHTAALKQL